jgi:cAMP phosphodiesterase
MQYLTTYLVNDMLAIDAGSLGYFASWAEQQQIRHVVLSHSHVDHIGSLPIFLENRYRESGPPVEIHGSDAVLGALRKHVFNDCLWPDLEHFGGEVNPFFKLARLQPGDSIELDGVGLTPVSVNHVVPTSGFLLEQDGSTVVLAMDTGPTDEIWRCAVAKGNLRAAFIEVTFPNSMAELARAAKHLTPAMFAAEAAKLPPTTRLIAVHIKASVYQEVVAELKSLGMPNVEVVVPGKEYVF